MPGPKYFNDDNTIEGYSGQVRQQPVELQEFHIPAQNNQSETVMISSTINNPTGMTLTASVADQGSQGQLNSQAKDQVQEESKKTEDNLAQEI